ncbi:MAG: hypothetical protein K0R72_134 [Clostridia bacterium]|jgi:hypothetical protein|nr:hypothetical protein [Clostridia bacterium]
MKIQVNGKEILSNQDGKVEILLEENDTLQLVTPVTDGKNSLYVMSYESSNLLIKGGPSTVENKTYIQ